MAEVLDVVAGFELERPLGRGGMGVVYRARDERLGRWVALKLIAPEIAGDDTVRSRFKRECRLAAAIDHPNVIPIYDAGEADGRLFLVMQLVEGPNLRTVIRAELRLEPERAVSLLGQVAGALDAAHGAGLVHRDVKPHNVLVLDPGAADHVYLTDFGLAQASAEATDFTAPGRWVGTPDYVAPEQLSGDRVDGRADVYALGCMLFEALTGHPPFDGSTRGEKLVAHLSRPAPRITDELPGAPAGLNDVIARALAKQPEERFATAGELIAATRAALDDARTEPSLPRPEPASPAIPAPATATFGRARDVDALLELLRRTDVRCVTVTGPGGVGKTRLAIEVARSAARSFKDGARFASLGAVAAAGLVADTIAQQLAVRTDSSATGEALVAYLADKELLLVLDNFEHVVAAALLVEELRAGCPGLTILTTSREPLRVPSEHAYHLKPLEEDAAAALFVDRAVAHDPAFRATPAEADTIAAICRRLDGLPLALELAAARTVLFAPGELLARLDHALPILEGGARDAPRRQQTLRAAIDWSHDLLDEDERAAFSAFAVFAGGADLEAVEAVTRAAPGTLAALVAKNLLVRRKTADGRTRLHMLATVREYAAERLDERVDAEALRARHCRYYVELAEQAELGLRGRDQRVWAQRLDEELGNLRSAVTWALDAGRSELAARLAGAAGLFLGFQRGRLGEVKEWLESAFDASHRLPLRVRAKASFALGVALQNLGETDAALRRCREAVRLYRRASDGPSLALSLAELSFMELEAGSAERAAAAGKEALERARETGDAWVTLFALCANLWVASDYGAAKRLVDEALAIARDLGVLDQQAMLLSNIGFRAIEEGDYAYARRATEAAVAIHRTEIDDVTGLVIGLGNLAIVATLEGADEEADAALREALRTCREHGLVRPLAEDLVTMAVLATRSADHARAARLCGAADALACDAPTRTGRELEAGARESARAVLGTDGWAAEWARGHELGFTDAIAYALGEREPAALIGSRST